MRDHRTGTPSAADPLLAQCALDCRAEFYPYGFPAVVSSNSPAVLEAAHAVWGDLRKLRDEPPLDLRCVVTPGVRSRSIAPVYRAQKNLLAAVLDGANFWCADLERGFATGWLSSLTVQDAVLMRYHFLEGMAGCLLDATHVVMTHAACVALHGRGVLLAGDSGAGKSSLAYACARRGWTYCSDDASALVRRAEDRLVMCNPRLFRFRDSARALFPEFAGLPESRRAQGKPTIEVPLAGLPEIRTARRVAVDCVVFLNRREEAGAPEVQPVPAGVALARLLQCPWPRELSVYNEHAATMRRLCGARLLELRYRDLHPAVDLLERLIGDTA